MKMLCWKSYLGVAALAATLAVLPFGGTSKAADAMKGSAMKSGAMMKNDGMMKKSDAKMMKKGDGMMMMKKIDPTLGAASMNMANAKVIATAFYADWCPLCKQMLPAWKGTGMWLKSSKKPVGVVRFDASNKKTMADSKALAAKEGLSGLYNRHKGETGFVYLLNASNHKLITTIKHTDSASEMEMKINNAIAAVNRSMKK